MKKRVHTQIIQKDIRAALSTGLKLEVEYLAAPDSCPACKKMNGIRMHIEEIDINNPPVPNHDCNREGGCRCTLLFIPID